MQDTTPTIESRTEAEIALARDTKPPIGSRVICWTRITGGARVVEGRGVVVRHGRDRTGPYTEVRLDDGTQDRFHRSGLEPEHAFRAETFRNHGTRLM